MMEKEYKNVTDKMDKTIAILKDELANIRAGRANPRLLDKVTVQYYGAPTPVTQLANISVPEARQIVIQPWDIKILSDIERAINAANLGLNPNNDGKVIRLIFPPLTEERRVELTKQVKKSVRMPRLQSGRFAVTHLNSIKDEESRRNYRGRFKGK